MKKRLALLLAAVLLLSAGCTVIVPAAPTAAQPADTTSAAPGTTAAPTAPVTTRPVATEPVSTAPAATQSVATEPVTTQPVTTQPAPEPVDPWTLIGEASFEQGSYTDGIGNTYSYSFDLPCINADTEGARAINEDIQEFFGGEVETAKSYMEDGTSLVVYSIGFYGEVWEDILTLVICTHNDFAQDYYGIYCYESSTGRWLTTRDVLARKGVSEEDFLDACRMQFRQFFEEEYADIPEESRTQYGYYEALERVDDELYLNMDLQAFPTTGGDIAVAAPIVSLAGADFYYHILNLGFVGNSTPDD